MKKRTTFIHSFIGIFVLIVGIITPYVSVGANSYYGGNGKLTFYSPVTLDDTTQEVYTINADGTGLAQVTDNILADANPQWAPSGTKVAFDHYVDGTNQQDLFIQNVASDGTGIEPATVVGGANTPAREFDPSWNPDGDTIAYHRCHLDGSNDCDTPYQVYTIPASGGSPTRVTTDDTYADTEPTWRKDGNYLTFTRRNVGTDVYGVEIAQPTAGGGTMTQVDVGDSSSDALGSPQWSPTANKIVYSKNGNFWIYDQDDNTKVQLTTVGGLSAPTWSPDGRYIASGGAGVIKFFSATTGELVHTTSVSSGGSTSLTPSDGLIEVDWARATAPSNTTHECTTYVNQDCTSFTPEIPDECQSVTTQPTHGTANYNSGTHSFTPETDYVGEDTYVYTYEDANLNSITCTVDITVLPLAPNTGTETSNHTLLYLIVLTPLMGAGLVVYKKRKQ